MDSFAIVSGALLGLVHVLSGPDHLAAIAPLAGGGQRAPAWLGVRWGLGHSSGVLLVAVAALFARDLLPFEALSSWSERMVGLALIGLGAWGFYRSRARPAREHRHERTAFAFGTLHGLAGSSHLLGVLPALAQPTRTDALVYLAGFALGTIAAMAAFASAIGWLASRAQVRGAALHTRLCGVTSAAAVLVGVWWLATGA
jgi:hypothetical protein